MWAGRGVALGGVPGPPSRPHFPQMSRGAGGWGCTLQSLRGAPFSGWFRVPPPSWGPWPLLQVQSRCQGTSLSLIHVSPATCQAPCWAPGGHRVEQNQAWLPPPLSSQCQGDMDVKRKATPTRGELQPWEEP